MWCSRLLWRRGDGAASIDGVVADSIVRRDLDPGGDSFRFRGIGLVGRASSQHPVGRLGVVAAGGLVKLALQRPDRRSGRLDCQPFLLGLVEPFHFAAGLRVVGPGMVEFHPEDPQGTEFDLQGDPALAALFGGEDFDAIAETSGEICGMGSSLRSVSSPLVIRL